MKILVTGGAGFIGSHIVDLLIKSSIEVIIIDNLTTGMSCNLNPEAKFYQEDILGDRFGEILKAEKPDIVIHHAAQVQVRKSLEEPLFDCQQNISASVRLIELCKQHFVKKIIYASTGGAAYGEPHYLPVDEEHPLRPLSPYGLSKHTVERYLDIAAFNHGLDYTVLRYSNVYGPRQNPHGEAGVIAIFLEIMMSGNRPTIFGDGSSTRDYVYVEDVARANLVVLNAGNRKTYNVSTGVQTSLKELYGNLVTGIGVSLDPIYASSRQEEVHKIALAYNKIKNELGWEPLTSLEDGLRKTIKSYLSKQK